MLKIDAYNHVYPQKYWDAMIDKAGGYEDLGKRTRSVPMLMDLEERFRVMDMFHEYKQILSLTSPPLEVRFSPKMRPRCRWSPMTAWQSCVSSIPTGSQDLPLRSP